MSDVPFDLGAALPTLAAPRGRVRLRWLTEADVPALFAVFGDAAVTRYWSHPPLAGLAAAAAYLAEIRAGFAARSLFQWGVELIGGDADPTAGGADRDPAAGGDRIIGTCTLAELDADHRRAELGFALARAHWGRGYMREILPVLIQFAFDGLGLHRLTADADPRNGASIHLLERLGFQREGLRREHYLVSGEKQDALLFGLLRSEARR